MAKSMRWGKMRLAPEKITPEKAREYLKMSAGNRRLRKSNIQALARDIKAGKFQETHQGIAFDTNSRLIDGQHRLHAIILANKPVTLLVTRGAMPTSKFVIDNNAPRDACDVFHFLGLAPTGNGSPFQYIGVLTQLIRGKLALRKLSNEELHALAIKYRDPICAVLNLFPRTLRHVSVAPVLAPIIRATLVRPTAKEKIMRFAEVLSTSVCDPKNPLERKIIDYREYLIASASNRDHQSVVKTYLKTAHLLDKFIKGELLTRFFAPDEDPFEWPKEMAPAPLKSNFLSSELEEKAARLRAKRNSRTSNQ